MIPSDNLKNYREQLSGWKLTALRLTANGRFIGYESTFLEWIDQMAATLKAETARTTNIALHEFHEAKRRIDATNDDLFPEICERLERTLILAEEVAYDISREEMEAFEKICEEDKVDPNEKVTEFIRVFVRQRRKHLPGTPDAP